MLKLCTGHYMNYYDTVLSGGGLFIIINEANGNVSAEKMHRAEKICEKYVTEEYIDKDARKELEDALEEVFEYGVQVYIAAGFEQVKR